MFDAPGAPLTSGLYGQSPFIPPGQGPVSPLQRLAALLAAKKQTMQGAVPAPAASTPIADPGFMQRVMQALGAQSFQGGPGPQGFGEIPAVGTPVSPGGRPIAGIDRGYGFYRDPNGDLTFRGHERHQAWGGPAPGGPLADGLQPRGAFDGPTPTRDFVDAIRRSPNRKRKIAFAARPRRPY